MQYELINIRTQRTDGKGSLSFFEENNDIPFDIKRVYYTYGVPTGTRRGGHAHLNLRQMLFCPQGKIEILLDDGVEQHREMLDSPSKGLVIGSMIWHEMIWHADGSVLVVAASDYYNESDYIRDYQAFLDALAQ